MEKDTKKSLIMLGNMSSMGIAMGVAIFGCFYLGLYLDGRFGTGHFFTFFLLILGIIAGFKNMYELVKKSLNNDKPSGEKDGAGGKKAPSKKD